MRKQDRTGKQVTNMVVRVLSAALFTLHGLLFTSCSSDDLTGYVPETETIAIVQNNLLFNAAGSTATVTVESDRSVEASINATWCKATVSGNTVTVEAEPNPSFDGRTAVLTVSNGKASRQLPVQQMGMILDLPLATNGHHSPVEGDEFSVGVRHDLPVSVVADQSWIHPVMTDTQLTVTVDDNRGGHIRRGNVICSCGDFADTLHIAQFDMVDDIVGSYYMMGYYGGNPANPTATRFNIIQRNDSLFMNWPTQRYEKVYTYVPFDATTCTLYIPSNFQLYNDGRTVDTAYFYDTNGSVCTTSGGGASARLTYSESVGGNSAALYAYKWPGHTLNGFVIRSVALTPTILLQLGSPVIMRIGPTEDTK